MALRTQKKECRYLEKNTNEWHAYKGDISVYTHICIHIYIHMYMVSPCTFVLLVVAVLFQLLRMPFFLVDSVVEWGGAMYTVTPPPPMAYLSLF